MSGYLPLICQWTHRELNPNFQHAELVSSRWTMSPWFWFALINNDPGWSRTMALLVVAQVS